MEYKEGQLVCALVPRAWHGSPEKWYFAKVFKICSDPKKIGLVEVYLYRFVEQASHDPTNRFEGLYPGVEFGRETVMLARLAAGMFPKEEDCQGQRITVRLTDICPATQEHFLKRILLR
ncbi:MAG: hypothetical protein HYV45_01625 [Candidatus Moranbacteria bacterium]|nr:hypothetical protein [Candidatus Moranbacteria bacterium]